MKTVEIETILNGYQDLKARAYYKGNEIDSHIHSSEYWLLHDWGFSEGKAIDGQEQRYRHDKKLLEIVGEPFTLIYKNHKRDVLLTKKPPNEA